MVPRAAFVLLVLLGTTPAATQEPACGDRDTIDILWVYTAPALAAVGSSEAELRSKFDRNIGSANEALANTGLPFRVRTVGVYASDYDESGDHLGLFRNRDDGVMDEIHGHRDDVAADVAVIIVAEGTCGLAYVAPDSEADAFQLVTVGCLDAEAFRHELGHNLGSKHWASDPGGHFPYSAGHVLVDAGVSPPATAMGGNSLPRFSNPRIRVNGLPTGVHLGSPEAADNYLAFLQTFPILAGFRCSGDCDADGMSDADTILAGLDTDCDGNGIPDSCQRDINANGIADACEGLPVPIAVPGDAGTIQEAIALAESGVHEVVVAPGTYTGPIDTLGKALVVRSTSGAEATTITGSGLTRAVLVRSGEDRRTVVEGFTLTGGSALGDGGAMLIDRASPTIRGCVFLDNTSTYAGGHVRVTDGLPRFEHCAFSGGTSAYGGAVSVWSGAPVFEWCTFTGNTATADGRGAAVSSWTSAASFVACRFDSNPSSAPGEVIFIVDAGPGQRTTIERSVVCGNTPNTIGPGTWDDGGHNTITEACAICPADTNSDGAVTPADFSAWIIAYNNRTPICDQNGDGLCTPADYNAWILNFNTGC